MRKIILQILCICIVASLITVIAVEVPIFTNIGSQDAWIGFCGALSGGSITLYGVWVTIQYTKENLLEEQRRLSEEKREDLMNSMRPLMVATSAKYTLANGADIKMEDGFEVYAENGFYSIYYAIECQNKGNSVLFNIQLSSEDATLSYKNYKGRTHLTCIPITNCIAENDKYTMFARVDIPEGLIEQVKADQDYKGNVVIIRLKHYITGKNIYGKDSMTCIDVKMDIAVFDSLVQKSFTVSAISSVIFEDVDIQAIKGAKQWATISG